MIQNKNMKAPGKNSSANTRSIKKYQRYLRRKVNTRQEFLSSDNLQTSDLSEKLLNASCYFTFGLSGLIAILLTFITSKRISRLTLLHTVQSIILGGIIAISIFLLKTLSIIIEAFAFILNFHNTINPLIYSNISLGVFCIACLFAVVALSGKNCILPPVKMVARQILN